MKLSFTINGDGELLIKPGQKVNLKDPLRKKKSQEEIKIQLASILQLPPAKIFKSLKKFVGDNVKKGELLAEHKGVLSTKRYHSEIDGIIKEVNHTEGLLIIETDAAEDDILYSFFQGEVLDLQEQTITLKIEEYKEFDLQETIHDFGGEIIIATDDVVGAADEEIINGKVMICGPLAGYNQIKLETLGGTAFVLTHPINEQISVPFAILKNSSDLEKIKKAAYPYCIVNTNNNKIYFYA